MTEGQITPEMVEAAAQVQWDRDEGAHTRAAFVKQWADVPEKEREEYREDARAVLRAALDVGPQDEEAWTICEKRGTSLDTPQIATLVGPAVSDPIEVVRRDSRLTKEQCRAWARGRLYGYAAVEAFYAHCPTITSDNDAGPNGSEAQEIEQALRAIFAAAFGEDQSPTGGDES